MFSLYFHPELPIIKYKGAEQLLYAGFEQSTAPAKTLSYKQ